MCKAHLIVGRGLCAHHALKFLHSIGGVCQVFGKISPTLIVRAGLCARPLQNLCRDMAGHRDPAGQSKCDGPSTKLDKSQIYMLYLLIISNVCSETVSIMR